MSGWPAGSARRSSQARPATPSSGWAGPFRLLDVGWLWPLRARVWLSVAVAALIGVVVHTRVPDTKAGELP
jgi:hypothetical protein